MVRCRTMNWRVRHGLKQDADERTTFKAVLSEPTVKHVERTKEALIRRELLAPDLGLKPVTNDARAPLSALIAPTSHQWPRQPTSFERESSRGHALQRGDDIRRIVGLGEEELRAGSSSCRTL
jgi:hypothetical protein